MSPEELRVWYEDYLDAGAHAARYRRAAKPRDGRGGGDNGHDLDRLEELLAPDVRRQGRPRGTAAWLADLEALLGSFPDLQWKRIRLVIEEDRIAAHLRARGTHRGAHLGVQATGRHVNWAEFGFYRVVAGRIVEYAGAADGADLLEQLTA